VSDEELHAFVDGQLPRERYAAVIAALAADAARLAQVADWAAQRAAIRALHTHHDPGPVPAALARSAKGERRRPSAAWAIAAALVASLVAGLWAGSAGWAPWQGAGAGSMLAGGKTAGDTPTFVQEAAVAHVVYTPEKRHPVEVAGSDEAHLVQWLSRRVGVPLRAPDLQPRGWKLLGGRLLPGDPSPRAQLMYECAAGRRLTLFVTAFPEGAAPAATSFRSVRVGSRESFYWIDGRYGYALSAEMSKEELQGLAREVWQQLDG
jgi:anti-sigma factor RsiW